MIWRTTNALTHLVVDTVAAKRDGASVRGRLVWGADSVGHPLAGVEVHYVGADELVAPRAVPRCRMRISADVVMRQQQLNKHT